MNTLLKHVTNDDLPELLLLLSYNACLSLGSRQLNPDDLLMPLQEFKDQHIPLYKTVRGGGLTYHWPGQLVVYPILKLSKEEQNIPMYMHNLEQVGLSTLRDFGIHASRKRDQAAQIGLWLDNQKIASMGIRVSKWVTSYGFALNLNGDTGPSENIKPCGLDGVQLTTIEQQIGEQVDREQAESRVMQHFESVFHRTLMAVSDAKANLKTKIQDVIYANR